MTEPGDAPLDRILRALAAARVPYAVIGAAARNAWAPPRLTTDLDFAVVADPDGYRRLVAALADLSYSPVRSHRADPSDLLPAVTIFRNEGAPAPYRQIDVLVAATPFEREAVERAVEKPLGDASVRVATREHLIVYKLIAWRPRDRQDVRDVIATAEVAGAALGWDLIRSWAAVWEVEDRLARALEPDDG